MSMCYDDCRADIDASAYNRGYEDGRIDGYNEGYADGLEEGKDEGYKKIAKFLIKVLMDEEKTE